VTDPEKLRALTFAEFSAANRQRCESSTGFNHRLSGWSTSDWVTALIGEVGEAANVVKKLNRYRDGIPGNKTSESELRAQLRQELGDVFVYLDLLAQSLGFSIADAAVEVFDARSDEVGYVGPRLSTLLAEAERPPVVIIGACRGGHPHYCPNCDRQFDVVEAERPTVEQEAHGYLSRLLTHHAPQCEPLPDLMGLCTQIDNLLVGLAERPTHPVEAERPTVEPPTHSLVLACREARAAGDGPCGACADCVKMWRERAEEAERPTVCTRHNGHFGPCNGFPREDCQSHFKEHRDVGRTVTAGSQGADSVLRTAWMELADGGGISTGEAPKSEVAEAEHPTPPVEDDWALARVRRMAEAARTSAGVYGAKLLKGHGYPDEVMRDAQDALALEEILARLAPPVEICSEECRCGWYDTAAQHARNEDYYRGLVDECAKHLGPEVFIADDGTVGDSVLRAKVPELVAALAVKATPPVEDDVAANLRAWQAWHQPQPTEGAVTRAKLEEWQDIATAPKDGRSLLLWSSHWRDGGKPVTEPVIGRWSSFSNCFVVHEGEVYKPTHWTPLPLRAHLKDSPDAD
jgi:NTP pyrophosphatase (non-canonical NTP hydrolase)